MEIKNKEIADNIESVIRYRSTNPARIAKKSGGLVTASLLNKIIKYPEESNPTIKTIRGVAHATKTEPWMFLVPNFPFNSIKERPLNKISVEGYTLLQAFEEASKQTQIDILKQAGYLLKSYDNNHKTSLKVEETAKKYQA